ncbi:MAG: histidine kinase [Cyclobacteriaceae bacterium]
MKISVQEMLLTTIIWLLLVLLSPLAFPFDLPTEFWIKQSAFGLLLSAIYFINARFIAPKLLSAGGIVRFVIYLLVLLLLGQVLMKLTEYFLNLPELMHQAIRPNHEYKPRSWFRIDFFELLFTLPAIGVSSIVFLVKKNQEDTLKRNELEKEKISNELSFLKTQINPHFYFNTLNSIYALADLNIEDAKESIHTLSSMMRHVLYKAQQDLTKLQDEINFIENYVSLMKLRMSKKVKVNFARPQQEVNELVAPMMFLPFVENAFKHGVSNQADSFINIEVAVEQDSVRMLVENSVFDRSSLSLDEGGIGIQNTRRRLDLIYPGKHQLDIKELENKYIVELKLQLR